MLAWLGDVLWLFFGGCGCSCEGLCAGDVGLCVANGVSLFSYGECNESCGE